MNRIFTNPINLLALLFIIVVGAWLAYLPNFVAGKLQSAIAKQTGREVQIKGGAGLVLSPRLGVALYKVELTGSYALAKPVVDAQSMVVPIDFSTLITGQFAPDTYYVDDADIAVTINGEGHSNVSIDVNPDGAKGDAAAEAPQPTKLTLSNSRLHFSDERDGTEFSVANISGDAQIFANGEFDFGGTASANEQFATVNASLNSLARLFEDGSPLDLNVDGDAGSISFNGQISTKGSLNLAGQADVSAVDTQLFARWLGIKFEGLFNKQKLSLSGPVETKGTDIKFNKAEFQLGEMHGKGNINFSNLNDRPLLSAELGMDKIDLSSFKPTANGNLNAEWSDKPFSAQNFAALDVKLSLSTNQLIYGSLKTGAATVETSLSNQHLTVELKSQAIGAGSGDVNLDVNAAQRPFKTQAKFNFTNVESRDVLQALFGINFVSGPATFQAFLMTLGESSADFISNLSGDATGEIKNGTVNGIDLSKVSALESDGWQNAFTPSINAQFRASFKDGVAKLDATKLRGINFSLPIEGEVDLLRQSLDLAVPSKVKITGPWARPKIFPDLSSALKTAAPLRK